MIDQQTLQLGATFLLAMSLIKLVEFIIGKYVNKSGNNNETRGGEILDQLMKMNNNHLHSIEDAIREQTKVFQEDHVRNLEVLYQIKAGVEQINKK